MEVTQISAPPQALPSANRPEPSANVLPPSSAPVQQPQPLRTDEADVTQQVSEVPQSDSSDLETRQPTSNEIQANLPETQQQIQSFLSDATGIDASEFEGIELEQAIELRDSLATTIPAAPAPAPASPQGIETAAAGESPDASDGSPDEPQVQQLRQNLEDRIRNATVQPEFPTLVDVIA